MTVTTIFLGLQLDQDARKLLMDGVQLNLTAPVAGKNGFLHGNSWGLWNQALLSPQDFLKW